MKKVITICLLVATFLVGGTTADAKTSKKKSTKTKTTQTSAAQWNGDIPSGTILYNTFFNGKASSYENQFIDHGYTVNGQHGWIDSMSKDGVIEMIMEDAAQQRWLTIVVYDSGQRKWLYNSLSQLVKSLGKRSGYWVHMEGNEILFSWSREW